MAHEREVPPMTLPEIGQGHRCLREGLDLDRAEIRDVGRSVLACVIACVAVPSAESLSSRRCWNRRGSSPARSRSASRARPRTGRTPVIEHGLRLLQPGPASEAASAGGLGGILSPSRLKPPVSATRRVQEPAWRMERFSRPPAHCSPYVMSLSGAPQHVPSGSWPASRSGRSWSPGASARSSRNWRFRFTYCCFCRPSRQAIGTEWELVRIRRSLEDHCLLAARRSRGGAAHVLGCEQATTVTHR